ncbi:MAG: hypothetical protein FWH32_01110 [Clostridiales bacterium]|nr:hypothetical protein [Clostridiales bacterium]
MTFQELIEFCESKKEHYCISYRFMKAGYQQKKGGYISTAKSEELEVDYKKAEPNQRWHFIEAYASKKAKQERRWKDARGEIIMAKRSFCSLNPWKISRTLYIWHE